MNLSPKGQKNLKLVHLVSVMAWVGSAIVKNCIRRFVIIDSPLTPWGKYRWVPVKWILTIQVIGLGAFSMGSLVEVNVIIGHELMLENADSVAETY